MTEVRFICNECHQTWEYSETGRHDMLRHERITRHRCYIYRTVKADADRPYRPPG